MSSAVPEGWKLHTIDEFSKTSAGGTPSTQVPEYWENGSVPWMSSGEVHKKRVKGTDQCITELGFRNSSAKLFPKGTILIALAGQGKTRGTVAISEIELTTNQSIAGIVVEEKNVSPEYVYQNLDSRYEELRAASGGSGRAGLNLSIIGEQQLLLPPLPEQQKIAAILSSVDDVIEKTRAQIDKQKDLKTGMMQELLTKGVGSGGVPHTEFKDSPVGKIPVSWQTAAMGEIFDFKNGVNKDKTAFGHGVPIISYKNVYAGGGIVDSDINALVEMDDQELERFRVNYGDVFFTRTSETPDEIGFTNVYLGSLNNVVFNGFVIRGRQKSNIFDPGFLKYVFQSNVVRKQMMDNSKFTTRAGISGESLGRIKLAIPNIPEQRAIASILDSIRNRINRVSNKRKAHESLKKALMQDLLTGKVRVSQKESAIAQ
ncbi:restriction endonuclease subunit S [Marinobacter alkaliphilus]|uniref:Restriction endonuclease subunit S n=1 Tax=Marinobacter alkaliphilus TaxID=254719 RepID=A0ABZ3E4Y9_9GAMM